MIALIAMFAKRQSVLAATAGLPPQKKSFAEMAAPVGRLLKKPPVAVASAGIMLCGTAALFLTVLGDPRAGAPSAQAKLDRGSSAAGPSGAEAFAMGAYGYVDLTDPNAPVDMTTSGEAYLTLPDGAYVSGTGAEVEAPVIRAQPLTAAPIAGLSQPGPDGLLPRIAADGRVPAQAYARPFVSNGKPRVALIVGGLGLNAVTTRAAIERLPAEVTLSFVPYADGLQTWIDQARAHGHEVMLEMPMEPTGYPQNDPGPYTLLSSAGSDDITAKMNWLLGRATGYFGVTNYMGDRFAQSDAGMTAFQSILRQRGVAFIDDGSMTMKRGAWSRASANRIIDTEQNAARILGELTALEALAKSRGQAMGTGFSYPVTVETAARWTAGLDARGLQLAPASAMAARPGR